MSYPAPDTEDWTERLRGTLTASVDSFIATGLLLEECKAALPHGQFERAVRAAGIAPSSARKLRAIAASPVGTSLTHERFPASWGTLNELVGLTETQLGDGVRTGRVHPEMTLADAKEVVRFLQGGELRNRDAENAWSFGNAILKAVEQSHNVTWSADPPKDVQRHLQTIRTAQRALQDVANRLQA